MWDYKFQLKIFREHQLDISMYACAKRESQKLSHECVLARFRFREGGVMDSGLDSGSNGPGSSAGHCVVLCRVHGKTPYSHSVSLSMK